MNTKYEKFLPIGSIVLLKEAKKRIMITGFCISSKDDKSKVFDYMGCLYPEGVIDSDKNLLFNHEDIDKIFAIGYSDQEEKDFKIKLKEEVAKMNNNQ